MDNSIVQKNLKYQKDVEQIAKMLFHAFYYDDEFVIVTEGRNQLTCSEISKTELESEFSNSFYEQTLLSSFTEKADKFLQFFSSVKDAKKTIQFLQTVNPIKAKEIVDGM